MFKVGVTGGIGSGKSTLCDIFRQCGVPIYNSDDEAKRLMSTDSALIAAIIAKFGEVSYEDGALNRQYLASIVFNDSEQLSQLNSLVHPAVKIDFERWANAQDAPYVILECAILFDAGFDEYIDVSVGVLAPENLRIERVMSRDNLTREQVLQRISNQIGDDEIHSRATYSVVNIDSDDLDNAARMLDKKFQYEASKR